MAITNPDHKTNLAGFNIPNFVLYIILAFIVFLAFSLWKGIRNIFRGIFGSSDTSGVLSPIMDALTDDKKKIASDVFKKIADLETVKPQLTANNNQLALTLYEAMNGAGTKEDLIFEVFKKITGPNQFAAIYYYYGYRSLSIAPTGFSWLPHGILANLLGGYTGDLIGALKSELSTSDLNKKIKNNMSVLQMCNYLKDLKLS